MGNKEPGKILRGLLHYAASDVGVKVVSLLLLPVFASTLSPEDFGMVDLYLALPLVFIPLFKIGIPGGVFRY